MVPWIIDLGPYIQSGGHSASEDEMTSLGKSLFEGLSKGVVYVKNSGIPLEKIRRALDMMEQFFALSLEMKQSYCFGQKLWLNGYGSMFTEWIGRDFGQPPDHKECYNFRLFREDGLSDVDPDKEVPGFSEAMMEAGTPFVPLSRWVLQCIALGAGLNKDTFDAYITSTLDNKPPGSNSTNIKISIHPAIDEGEDLSGMIRCGRHVDGGLFAWDVMDTVGGLQVQAKDGNWMDVSPVPDTVVIIPGQLLAILLSDRIPAAIHQVVVSSRDMARQQRRAFILFMNPDTDAEIKPLDGSDVYQPTSVAEIAKYYLDLMGQKSE